MYQTCNDDKLPSIKVIRKKVALPPPTTPPPHPCLRHFCHVLFSLRGFAPKLFLSYAEVRNEKQPRGGGERGEEERENGVGGGRDSKRSGRGLE